MNILATTKTEGNDKFLILKSKFVTSNGEDTLRAAQNDPRNSIGIPTSPVHVDFNPHNSPGPRLPPPYRPPPPVQSPNISLDNISISSNFSFSDCQLTPQLTPQIPPRKKSIDKDVRIPFNLKSPEKEERSFNEEKENESPENGDKQISVKERTQKFNRLASVEDDLSPRQVKDKKKIEKKVSPFPLIN